jgi:uncharacterized membrane protein/DNA-directed RNA polymerase subunit RPC12/RpoP
MTQSDAKDNPYLCLKCGYERRASDHGPSYACPRCGAVYAKVRAAMATAAASVPNRAAAVATAAPIGAPATDTDDDPLDREIRASDQRDTLIAHAVYLLYVLPLGTALIGVIIAHVMRAQDTASWLDSHFRWQVRTFWIFVAVFVALLLVALGYSRLALAAFKTGGAATMFFWLSLTSWMRVAFILLTLWGLYRVVRGWVQLVRKTDVP